MATFKIGDTVVLKSGGPKMTVTKGTNAYGDVDAMWFAGAKRESGSFPPQSIQLYIEPEPKK